MYEQFEFRELIDLYKKVSADYAGTLQEITGLSNRLTDYERNMDSRILELQQTFIPEAVNTAVTNSIQSFMQEVNTQINSVHNDYLKTQQDISALETLIERTFDASNKEIEAIRGEVISFQNQTSTQITNLNNQFTGFTTEIRNEVQELTVNQGEFMQQISDWAADFEKEIAEINAEFQNLMNDKVNAYYLRLKYASELDVSALREEIAENSKKDNAYTDKKISALNQKVDAISEQLGVQGVRWLYDNCCNVHGYSALQWYNDVEITCECWNSSAISCLDWYIRGRDWFNWWRRMQRVISPISGKPISPQHAIIELANALKVNAFTAEEYDRLQLDADRYERIGFEAQRYDWAGKETDVY